MASGELRSTRHGEMPSHDADRSNRTQKSRCEKNHELQALGTDAMNERVFNFSAGPAVLPEEVLRNAQQELMCLPGAGASGNPG